MKKPSRASGYDRAYLFYVLRHFAAGAAEIVRRLEPLASDPVTGQALAMLEEDFAEIDSVGPVRVAEFLLGASDDAVQADARGLVLDFLDLWAATKK